MLHLHNLEFMCWYKVKKQSKSGINGKNIFIIEY